MCNKKINITTLVFEGWFICDRITSINSSFNKMCKIFHIILLFTERNQPCGQWQIYVYYAQSTKMKKINKIEHFIIFNR